MRYADDSSASSRADRKTGCAAADVGCRARLPQRPANAIDYEDDTERFIQDVRSGIPIALLAAPVAVNSFADYRQVFGYLHNLGVRSFHNVLLRADITVWAYLEVMRNNAHGAFLSSPCAAVTEYIRRHRPGLRPHLMPVYSPLLCTAIYLRKYCNLTDRIAFLSPCVAKRKEIKALDIQGYNITINKLQQYMTQHQIDLSSYDQVDFNDRPEGAGLTLGVYRGVSESIAAHLANRQFVKISGPGKVYRWLEEYEQIARENGPLPHLAELYNCHAGCEGGTGISTLQKKGLEPVDAKWFKMGPAAAETSRSAAADLFTTFNQTLQLTDFMP